MESILTYDDVLRKYPQCKDDLLLLGADASWMFRETVEPMSNWAWHAEMFNHWTLPPCDEDCDNCDYGEHEHRARFASIRRRLQRGETHYPIFAVGRVCCEGNHRLVAFQTLGLENVTVIRPLSDIGQEAIEEMSEEPMSEADIAAVHLAIDQENQRIAERLGKGENT